MKQPDADSAEITLGNLAALLSYQADAIVSRVLSKSEAGSVTLFAFAAGQELSEHTAPFEALAYMLDGKAEFGVAGEPHHAIAGDMVRLPANIPHWVRGDGPFKMMLVMLRHPARKKE